jgi:hypothetical protein
MKKTNSIIEEALIEASQLEEAVKEVGKEVLASAMKQEIEDLIKSSLTEEEEVESPEMDSMGMETPEMPEVPEMPEMDDENPEMPEMDDEEGDEEVMDMTQASDTDVIKVFKAMGPEDSIEVTKTDNGVRLKDGDKEYILQMEGVEEMTDEELDEYLDEAAFEDFDDLEIEMDDDDDDDDDEVLYDIEMDDDEDVYPVADGMMDEDEEFEDWMREMMDEDNEELDEYGDEHPMSTKDALEKEEVMYEIELSEEEEVIDEDEDEDEDDEDLEEAARTYGFGSKDGSRGLRKAITPNRNYSYKNGFKVESLSRKLSLVESELESYKAKNVEYKKALSTLKEKMNEMAVYYTNLSYTNKLFTEHTTTKKEKLDILKRFDNVKNINESKSLFGSITDELSNKKSISNLGDLSESVDRSLNSSSSKLTESVVYEDPKIKQIKELMAKLSPSRK